MLQWFVVLYRLFNVLCVFGLGEFPREKLQLFNASAMFMWLVHVVLPYEFFSCEA